MATYIYTLQNIFTTIWSVYEYILKHIINDDIIIIIIAH